MTEEKIIDTVKKENQPQDKFADERLTDEQLDKVAGGCCTLNSKDLKDRVGTSGKQRL